MRLSNCIVGKKDCNTKLEHHLELVRFEEVANNPRIVRPSGVVLEVGGFMSTRNLSSISSLLDWIHERMPGTEDRESDRQRLAKLHAHNNVLSASAMKRTVPDDDRDNYLRGELISADHDEFEKHNNETVAHWLHPEDDAIKKPASP